MPSKKKVTVAVTGLNNIDSPGPGIPVIRGLRDSKEYDVRIIGLSYDALEPGIYMHDLVDKSYQIPLPSAGIASIMERLKYINTVENIDVIIPNFDAELYNFIKMHPLWKKNWASKVFCQRWSSLRSGTNPIFRPLVRSMILKCRRAK